MATEKVLVNNNWVETEMEHPQYLASQVAAKSLSAGNNKICTVSGIKAGKYMVCASTHIAMSGDGNAYFNLYKATNNTNKLIYDNKYVKSGSSWVATSCFATFPENGDCSLYIEVTSACTIDNCYLELLKIA